MAVANSSRFLNTEIQHPVIWAIIPARGGSKRLPRKNILPFAGGLSLTARTVQAAIAAQIFARVVVSTDDEEIAEDGRQAGALVPFLRPVALADDTASSVDVLRHAVSELRKIHPEERPVAVCLLQVTSPMLVSKHISEAVDLFLGGGFNSLSSMAKVSEFPEWMFRVEEPGGAAVPEDLAGITRPSAEILPRYIENGAIYLVKTDWLDQTGSLYDFAKHGCYAMTSEDSVDIDTRTDWDYAEFLTLRRNS
ncbi:MAG: acylneuraminate cytidylyltransferase family protein [Candidatus Riflebacteria bacterium]|nr:acylneuraminate cytidylyltransferase family protein [Candidatus Riflebacteria bacterium]